MQYCHNNSDLAERIVELSINCSVYLQTAYFQNPKHKLIFNERTVNFIPTVIQILRINIKILPVSPMTAITVAAFWPHSILASHLNAGSCQNFYLKRKDCSHFEVIEQYLQKEMRRYSDPQLCEERCMDPPYPGVENALFYTKGLRHKLSMQVTQHLWMLRRCTGVHLQAVMPWQRNDQRLQAKYIYKELIINPVNTELGIHMDVHTDRSLLGVSLCKRVLFNSAVRGLRKIV
jgi:hypothetical protein